MKMSEQAWTRSQASQCTSSNSLQTMQSHCTAIVQHLTGDIYTVVLQNELSALLENVPL
jgi:hypothetical protein